MTTPLYLFGSLLRLLEYSELDANFINLRTTADAALPSATAATTYSPLAGPGTSQAFVIGALSTTGINLTPVVDGAGITLNQQIGTNSVGLSVKNSNYARLYTNGIDLVLNEYGGNVRAPGIYTTTTASAPNIFVDTDGTLRRSTSSERYKTGIEPLLDINADKLLQAQPIWYRSLCAGDNPDWSYYGLSAEALAEIDPRYVFWSPQYKIVTETIDESVQVTEPVSVIEESVEIINGRAILTRTHKTIDQPVYDEYPLFDQAGQAVMVNVDGNEQQATCRQPRMATRSVPHETRVVDDSLPMIPDGVQYERLTVALLSIVQRQKLRLDALEGK